jgi:glycosyltransferase involved in cell wall biosynthesis
MTRPIRVAFLTAALDSGGSERQMLALAARLPKDRFEIDFILFADLGPHAEEARRAGARIVELGLGRRRDVSLPRFAARLVRMALRYVLTVRLRGYDIVDAWLFHSYVLAAACRPIAGPPVLIAGRRSLGDFKAGFGPIARALDAIARRAVDVLVANADAVRNDVVAREGVDPSRIRVIHNGVNPGRPMKAATRARIRRRWGVGEGDLVVGCVANLKRGMGLEALVRAAERLVPANPALRFVVIGEGTLRPLLETRVAQAGLGDSFRLVGWEKDARRVYGALDIVVQTSETEGLPNVMLEAAAAGCAIAATAAGGTPEVVIDDRTGLLFGVADEPAMATAIDRLARDPALRQRLADGAREHVARSFSMDRFVAETAALYEAMARLTPRPR